MSATRQSVFDGGEYCIVDHARTHRCRQSALEKRMSGDELRGQLEKGTASRRYGGKGYIDIEVLGLCHLSKCLVARTADCGCRISTVVYVRVDARIELVANVCRVWSMVGGASRSSSMIQVGIVSWVGLVANV